MAPILIDGRGLFKLGFSAIIITALIFFGGFFAGYQKASAFYQYASEAQPLMLPDVADNTGIDRDPLIPQVAPAGEDIDVDQPEDLSSAGVIQKHHTHDDIHAHADASRKVTPEAETSEQGAVSAVNTIVDDQNSHKSIMTEDDNNLLAVAGSDTVRAAAVQPTELEPAPHNKVSVDKEDENTPNAAAITASIVSAAEASTDVYSLSAGELEKAKYSIQVGMYGNIINAENMMKMLQAQKINAYISDYKNKKDEIRYNVRFGLFQNKRSAVVKLDEYNSLGRGDGYLVRFSVENLVNLADAGKPQVLPAALVSSSMADGSIGNSTGYSTDSASSVEKPGIDSVSDRSNKLSQADLIVPGSSVTN